MLLPEFRKNKLSAELHVSASRSGGPGGQNVNKVNTKIELRFHVDSSEELNEVEKQLIRTRLKNRINSEGELLVTSSSERTQWKNREQAEKKFFELIEKAITIQKHRVKTRPTTVSKIKRMEFKKKQAQKKEDRKSVV